MTNQVENLFIFIASLNILFGEVTIEVFCAFFYYLSFFEKIL